MANVAQMREAVRQRGMQMGLNFCLMAVNWSEFAGFLEFAEELEARPWVTLVEFPRKRSLLAMPRARLCRVVDQLRERPPRVEPGGRGAMLWESMLQSLAVFAACENTGRAERVVSSLLGRARWLWRIGQHDAALAVASRVDRVSPLHREARVQRAQWHAARGEPTAAARLLESVGDGGAAGAQPPIAVPPVT
jgi:hypothetical protein